MPISLILSLVGPIIVNVATQLFQRLWKQGTSTLQGTAAGAGVIALLESSGCSMTGLQEVGVGLIAAAPGLFGTDAGKTSQPIWAAAVEKVKEARSKVTTPQDPIA